MSKILLREHHLKVGTVFKTVNRFYPDRDWCIHRIEKLDLEKDVAALSVLAYKSMHGIDFSKYHPRNGDRTLFTYPSAHTKHSKTTWISYYLPEGELLYGDSK